MTALVVYESMYGNTRTIAEAVARGLSATNEVRVLEVGEAHELPPDLELLVVGGPTHAFGMSRPQSRDEARSKAPDRRVVSEGQGLREWLAALPHQRRPVAAAVFDTKVRKPLTGSAAKGAAKALKAAGFRLVAEPADFGVQGSTGPLEDGEIERAEAWGSLVGSRLVAT